MGGAGDAHLEEADGAGEVEGLLLVGHVAHLVGDCFEPGLVGFDEGNHLGEPRERKLVRYSADFGLIFTPALLLTFGE